LFIDRLVSEHGNQRFDLDRIDLRAAQVNEAPKRVSIGVVPNGRTPKLRSTQVSTLKIDANEVRALQSRAKQVRTP
jgi:hypothetical protein